MPIPSETNPIGNSEKMQLQFWTSSITPSVDNMSGYTVFKLGSYWLGQCIGSKITSIGIRGRSDNRILQHHQFLEVCKDKNFDGEIIRSNNAPPNMGYLSLSEYDFSLNPIYVDGNPLYFRSIWRQTGNQDEFCCRVWLLNGTYLEELDDSRIYLGNTEYKTLPQIHLTLEV